MHIYMHSYVPVKQTNIHTYLYVLNVNIHICIRMHAHTHEHRRTHTDTDKDTKKDRHRHTQKKQAQTQTQTKTRDTQEIGVASTYGSSREHILHTHTESQDSTAQGIIHRCLIPTIYLIRICRNSKQKRNGKHAPIFTCQVLCIQVYMYMNVCEHVCVWVGVWVRDRCVGERQHV